MIFRNEQKILKDYLLAKNLRNSEQRSKILETFLKSERHISADELYRMVKKRIPTIGYATIYRTLKILCECGICKELRIENGVSRYEPLYGHEHHDHLICLKCGKFIEVSSPEIEKLQEKIAKSEGFILMRHRLELYGICKRCNSKS